MECRIVEAHPNLNWSLPPLLPRLGRLERGCLSQFRAGNYRSDSAEFFDTYPFTSVLACGKNGVILKLTRLPPAWCHIVSAVIKRSRKLLCSPIKHSHLDIPIHWTLQYSSFFYLIPLAKFPNHLIVCKPLPVGSLKSVFL